MKTSALLVAAAALLLMPARADAQVKLQIQNGLVMLDAQNVSVRQILAEWARIGGARIVNGEKVAGGPVTLHLNGIPERQALDTILRGVSGYMLASRQAGTAGVSDFDRILILPTSSAPRANAAPPNAPYPGARPMPTPAPVAAEPVETEIVEEDENQSGLEPDVDAEEQEGAEVVQPQPGANPGFQQRPPNFPNPMGVQGQPFGSPATVPGQPQPVDEDEAAAPQPATTNPFGVPPPGASTMPGVIAPVPQQDPRQPQTTRPPRPPR